MQAKLLRGFFLGNLKVEPLKGQISDHGAIVQLSPEALDVLLQLASRAGEALSSKEIIAVVWGQGQGSQQALYASMSELFEALGDDRNNPQYIATEPNRGYRLIATVKTMHFSASGQPGHDHAMHDDELSGIQFLWMELKKRKVARVGISYLIVAWLSLQVADVITPVLNMPLWTMKLLTLLLGLGFVITLIMSWLVQITPAGIRMEETSDRPTRGNRRHLLEFGIIMVLLVAVSVLVYRQFWTGSAVAINDPKQIVVEPGDPVIDIPPFERSIAVLPFVTFDDSPEDKYFGDGLAEELLHKLAKVKSLKVAARTSSFSIAGKNLEIPDIAKQLHVMTVLEGSVRRDGGVVRVTAQLVDADGFHLWSDTYNHAPGKVLEVQSNIALSVAKRIVNSLTPEASAAILQNPTENPEAYDLYLQGLAYLRKPRQQQSLSQATDLLGQAIELDPRFARAFAAACETQLSWYRMNQAVEHFEQAERQCNRALTLDSSLVEVYTALGNLYRVSGQYEDARIFFEQAMQLNPYYEEATYGLARSLQGLGDLKGAELLLQHSIELEPGFWGPWLAMGNFLHRLGRYEEAVPFYEKVTQMTPDNPDGYTNLGTALFDSGSWEEAEIAWIKSIELAPTPMGYRNMGTMYYYQGKYAESAAMHKEAIELAPDDHWLWGKLGAAYREMSDAATLSQSAFEQARKLANERLKVDVDDSVTRAYLAAYLAGLGLDAEAREAAEKAVELEPENPEVWYFSGLVSAQQGNKDQALSELEQALALGYSKRLLATDPLFADLSETAGFRQLIKVGDNK